MAIANDRITEAHHPARPLWIDGREGKIELDDPLRPDHTRAAALDQAGFD